MLMLVLTKELTCLCLPVEVFQVLIWLLYILWKLMYLQNSLWSTAKCIKWVAREGLLLTHFRNLVFYKCVFSCFTWQYWRFGVFRFVCFLFLLLPFLPPKNGNFILPFLKQTELFISKSGLMTANVLISLSWTVKITINWKRLLLTRVILRIVIRDVISS